MAAITPRQEQLWHDTLEDALKDVLIGIYGRGWAQKAAADMYPTEEPLKKGDWLEKALNRERREKLSSDDVIWILRKGREHGIHTGMYFIADDCCYSRPEIISREQRKEAIKEELERKCDEVIGLMREFKQLNGV